MESLSVLELVYVAVVMILAYAIRGSAGFGGANGPLLALVLPLKLLAPMINLLGLISSYVIVAKDHRHIAWREMWRFMPFCLVGVLLGLYFFKTLDTRTLAISLGVFVICYGTYSLLTSLRGARAWAVPPGAVAPPAGAAAGFVGTLFGTMAGVFLAIYLDSHKLDKHRFRATAAATLFGLSVARAAGYFAVGAFDRDTLLACAAALPLMAIGVFLGNHIHANLNQSTFHRLVALVMIASGVLLLAK